MIKRLLLIVLLPFVTSCASLSEESCIAGDWATIGYKDGTNGQLVSYVDKHREACAEYGVSPDVETWARYRLEGLKEYCTPANAYSLGRDGRRMNDVCRQNRESLQLANYYGLQYFEISEDIEDLEDEEDTIHLRLASEFTGELTPELIQQQQTLISRLRKISREIRALERELRRYDDLP